LEPEFFTQMTAEVRNEDGVWENPERKRQEDWDLHTYNRAACILLNAEKLNWDSPPEWAQDFKLRDKQSDAARKTATIEKLARGLNG
jgi:phage terminase large subunit GpA-like protein